MGDLSALKAKIDADYPSESASGIMTALNAKNIAAKKPISAHDIRAYLMISDLLLTIETGASDAAKAATRCLEIFVEFDIRNPLYEGKLIAILNALVADTLIPDFTETHKTVILAMGDQLVSWADQNWTGDVTLTDIMECGHGNS